MKRKLIVELPNGKYRAATGPEAKAAKKAEAERLELESTARAIEEKLEAIYKSCLHLVCQDKGGTPTTSGVAFVVGTRASYETRQDPQA